MNGLNNEYSSVSERAGRYFPSKMLSPDNYSLGCRLEVKVGQNGFCEVRFAFLVYTHFGTSKHDTGFFRKLVFL